MADGATQVVVYNNADQQVWETIPHSVDVSKRLQN